MIRGHKLITIHDVDHSLPRHKRQMPQSMHARQGRAIAILAEQDLAKSRAKVGIEHRVYNRIQKAVEISEPVDDADEER